MGAPSELHVEEENKEDCLVFEMSSYIGMVSETSLCIL